MGKSRFHWLFFPLLKLASNFRRCPLSKRSLIISVVCLVYLFFVVSQVGYSQQHRGRRTDKEKNGHTSGLYDFEINGVLSASDDSQTGGSIVVPTRSNVVYITLKSKRLKPAHIRGTIRPKLRRKVKRNKSYNPSFTQNKLGSLEQDAGHIQRNFALRTPRKETSDIDYKLLDVSQKSNDANAESQISLIRIYSQKAPPWFSAQDVKTMRFLADGKVLRMKEVSHGDVPSLLIFEGETDVPPADQKYTKRRNVCGGQCGIVHRPVDNTEVFAFHLDRVLGLNRTLPTVSRKFSFLYGRSSSDMITKFLFSDY